jgi:anthranilate phosphoribosyltransferase
VAELKGGEITLYTVTPEEFGLPRSDLSALAVSDAGQSLAMINEVLDNRPGPARDIVMLNAGAAIYAAGVADSLAAGVGRAAEVLADGSARETLASLVRVSNAV